MSFFNRPAPLDIGESATTAIIDRPGVKTSETAVLDLAHLGDITSCRSGDRRVTLLRRPWRAATKPIICGVREIYR